MSSTEPHKTPVLSRLFGAVLALLGLALGGGGLYLVILGGSSYYLLAGAALIAAGVQYARGRSSGLWIYVITAALTLIWALADVGLTFWPLVARLSGVLALLIPAFLLAPWLKGMSGRRGGWFTAAGVTALAGVAGLAGMFVPHGVIQNPVADYATRAAAIPAEDGTGDWSAYGRTKRGTRFAPFTQINADNIDQLEVAWTYRTGEMPGTGSEYQNTPVQLDDTLYICTPLNKIIAIDAVTGEERWRFDPEVENNSTWTRCRGVSVFDSTDVSMPPDAPQDAMPAAIDGICARRIISSTTDGSLVALDAETGEPCPDFGTNGIADLRGGLGEIKTAYYVPTSAPMIAAGRVIVGGWVYDGQEVGEPSGVLRAFDARTGEIVWAWDMGQPDLPNPPPADTLFTRGTPNMWSTPAYDRDLGLIYVPTGNSTPDYWGGHRRDFDDEYSSSVVALNILTGKPAWHFQTTHHDLWDYDVPSQPALYDIPDGNGGTLPAVIQQTKRGHTFVLDRRTGEPIREVEERPVPQDVAPGDWLSPTQPFSTEMPFLGKEVLTEADMWGATPLDQLYCRIAFKRLRYDGPLTPPNAETMSLQNPGNFGGQNWGSGAINEDTGLMFVKDINLPIKVQLLPTREEVAAAPTGGHEGRDLVAPQSGTPFAVYTDPFMSPLGVPCVAPPFGTLSAVDLVTSEIVWQRPAGTIEDTVVGGLRASAPIPLGMPPMGGPLSTRAGLVFYAGTQDFYLRAFDETDGTELWKGRMPAGSQGSPMSYVSPTTGKQYIVIVSGGARQSPVRGDYVIAYALPDDALNQETTD
ncbi:membrane-bound PQQ-dependent dehydrogenase, glucose/quinate/shikimate family [Salipiger abyssi]|uniref:membrane-bound PQQ-dependent dehydrogenase, glucose/quinate/shikimate family n=1 Tax=Salipiger abyssi TaxID=1250539 RepID=UPI004059E08D